MITLECSGRSDHRTRIHGYICIHMSWGVVRNSAFNGMCICINVYPLAAKLKLIRKLIRFWNELWLVCTLKIENQKFVFRHCYNATHVHFK